MAGPSRPPTSGARSVTRAETLVTRHPDSKYVDEALVLKGLALSRLSQCNSAVAPLGHVSLLPEDAEDQGGGLARPGTLPPRAGGPDARGGGARARGGERGSGPSHGGEGDPRLERCVSPADPTRPSRRSKGSIEPRARAERLLALAAAHRREAALALADSLLSVRDTTVRWDTVAAAVGRVEPLVASALVDRLKGRQDMPPATRAQMLFEDAVRLAPLDTARTSARLREVAALPEPPEYVERARLALTRQRIANVSSVDELRPFTAELQARAASRTTAASEAGIVRAFVSQVLSAADSAAAGAARADLQLFLAAETARDSLAAPALAVTLFRTVVERLPDCPTRPRRSSPGTCWTRCGVSPCCPSSRSATRRAPTWPSCGAKSRTATASWRTPSRPSLAAPRPRGWQEHTGADAPGGFARGRTTAPHRGLAAGSSRERCPRLSREPSSAASSRIPFSSPPAPPASGRSSHGVMDLERLGGLVTKAVSLEPRAGNRPPRVAEFRGGMLNSVGLANPGLAAVRERHLPWLAANLRRAQVLVNVVGFTVEEYAQVVAGLDGAAGIAGFELNLSCPNTSAGGIEFGAERRLRAADRRALPGAHATAARRQALSGAAGHRRAWRSSRGTRAPTGSRW